MSDRGGHGRFGRTVPRCEVRRAAIAGRGRRPARRCRRDLLPEGNEYYFHREYTFYLDKNLQLRERILQQSRPTPAPISTTTPLPSLAKDYGGQPPWPAGIPSGSGDHGPWVPRTRKPDLTFLHLFLILFLRNFVKVDYSKLI
jgi:hypothetical protein